MINYVKNSFMNWFVFVALKTLLFIWTHKCLDTSLPFCFLDQTPPASTVTANCIRELSGSRCPFASPERCSFNRSIMPCGVPVQFRCNLQQALWSSLADDQSRKQTGRAADVESPMSDVQWPDGRMFTFIKAGMHPQIWCRRGAARINRISRM